MYRSLSKAIIVFVVISCLCFFMPRSVVVLGKEDVSERSVLSRGSLAGEVAFSEYDDYNLKLIVERVGIEKALNLVRSIEKVLARFMSQDAAVLKEFIRRSGRGRKVKIQGRLTEGEPISFVKFVDELRDQDLFYPGDFNLRLDSTEERGIREVKVDFLALSDISAKDAIDFIRELIKQIDGNDAELLGEFENTYRNLYNFLGTLVELSPDKIKVLVRKGDYTEVNISTKLNFISIKQRYPELCRYLDNVKFFKVVITTTDGCNLGSFEFDGGRKANIRIKFLKKDGRFVTSDDQWRPLRDKEGNLELIGLKDSGGFNIEVRAVLVAVEFFGIDIVKLRLDKCLVEVGSNYDTRNNDISYVFDLKEVGLDNPLSVFIFGISEALSILEETFVADVKLFSPAIEKWDAGLSRLEISGSWKFRTGFLLNLLLRVDRFLYRSSDLLCFAKVADDLLISITKDLQNFLEENQWQN